MANQPKSQNVLPLSPELLAYSHRIGRAMDDEHLQKLYAFASKHEYAQMNSACEQIKFLQLLVQLNRPKIVIEVGVYLGLTTLALAQVLPQDSKVIALELRHEFTDLAEPYWQAAGVRDKIDLRIGPALESLEKIDHHVDMIYIDCDKPNYENYVKAACHKLIRPGGLVLVDNTLWHGRVIVPEEKDDNTVAIRQTNEYIRSLDPKQFQISNLPIGDGLTIILKLH